jgi:hypothetical protein
MRRIILSSVASLALPYFFYSFSKTAPFSGKKKKVTGHEMCVLIFSISFASNISHSKKNSARYIIKMHTFSYKSQLVSSDFDKT